jgi:hypothetical protein
MERRLLKLTRNLPRNNKRGIVMGNVLFILLNIAFFALVIYFVRDAASGAGMKEKILSKEIALMINAAKPGTSIEIDISAYEKIAKKNGIKNFIEIGSNNVTVTLSGKGFVYPYFSMNKVEYKYGEEHGLAGFLYMKVSEVKA